jgi:hypothetical protein
MISALITLLAVLAGGLVVAACIDGLLRLEDGGGS